MRRLNLDLIVKLHVPIRDVFCHDDYQHHDLDGHMVGRWLNIDNRLLLLTAVGNGSILPPAHCPPTQPRMSLERFVFGTYAQLSTQRPPADLIWKLMALGHCRDPFP